MMASSGSRSASAPAVRQELTKLYAALTGERPAFVDAEDAAIELAARLEDKNCLIVIDDVWEPERRRSHSCAAVSYAPASSPHAASRWSRVPVRAVCSLTR